MNRLSRSFFNTEDVLGVSQKLLGKHLVSNIGNHRCSGIIVETEAYRAPDDKACHAYQNKRTPRTETMFAKPGTVYVYICYGIHHLFNIVTAPEGKAHAILIRAIQPIEGTDIMLQRRNMSKLHPRLVNGPGKFTVAMGINKSLNAIDLCDPKSPVWIEESVSNLKSNQIIAGPRVGMSTAEECSNWPWRFRIKGNKFTSKPDVVFYPEKV